MSNKHEIKILSGSGYYIGPISLNDITIIYGNNAKEQLNTINTIYDHLNRYAEKAKDDANCWRPWFLTDIKDGFIPLRWMTPESANAKHPLAEKLENTIYVLQDYVLEHYFEFRTGNENPEDNGMFHISEQEIRYFEMGSPKHLDSHTAIIQDSSFPLCVQRLYSLVYYLKYFARAGDYILLNNPEAGLSPAKQVKFAQILATLANLGIRVIINTCSDFIIGEINTLTMIERFKDKEKSLEYTKRHCFDELAPININKVDAYHFHDVGNLGLSRKMLEGIIADVFDQTIDYGNFISDKVYFDLQEERDDDDESF